jgi:hypothetical protein
LEQLIVKTEIMMPEYEVGDIWDTSDWFLQATVEEVLAIDVSRWSTTFEGPLLIPFFDVLAFYRGREGYGQLTEIIDRLTPGYGSHLEKPRGGAQMTIDSFAALNWLWHRRPTMMRTFDAQRKPMTARFTRF